ncbi:MAG: hypothetical protein F9K29_12975 [Hyphomicrobiaceae bacterium]|nr:MAG: hypothetical protein F9K29_12975 [Hyphomicrobiaceae bacterium]
MAARILSLARVPERRPNPAAACAGPACEPDVSFHFWRGASGRRYIHSVYSLIECPPLPKACFVLARRDEQGHHHALHIGCSQSDAPTLNLAYIRQRGAFLGANEVHVHFLANADEQRQLVACDLRAGQYGELGAEPSRATHAATA